MNLLTIWLKLYSNLLILSLMLLTHVIVPVSCSEGIFEIHIKKYVLYETMNLDKCCPASDATSTSCASDCNIFMEICLSIYQKVPHRYACDIGENIIVTDVLGNDKLSSAGNRDYSIKVRERWNKNFNILVRIKHKDVKTKKEQVIVTLSSAEENVKPSSDWISKHLSNPKDFFELSVSFRYSCSKYHYGDQCDRYCKPSSSAVGHYNCSSTGDIVCHSGYNGSYCDKVTCQDKCNHGRCIGPNMCRCFTGWSGDSCDTCIPYPGCVNGDCRQDEKTGDRLPLTCDCAKGWGGMFCNIDLDYCSNNPNVCLNDGECQNFGNINTNQQYRCLCKPGFRGTHCEKSVTNCAVRGCLNEGKCHINEKQNSSRCLCQESFYGDRCQFNMTSCAESPCVGSNSKCIPDPKSGFLCECATGFIGRNCEIDKDECHTNPCLNGGMCIDRASGFRCVCPVGFSGDRCQVNKNDCQRLSCMNGAKCMDKANSIDCECTAGWAGAMCNHNINECATNQPCLNGGTCEDTPGSYKCLCTSQWSGEHCQLKNTTTGVQRRCLINPCGNNGLCYLSSNGNSEGSTSKEMGGSYYCLCPPGFTGLLCKQVVIANGSVIDTNDNIISTAIISNTKKRTKGHMTLINLIIIAIGVPAILVILAVVGFLWCKSSERLSKSNPNSKYQNNTMKNNNFSNNAHIKILNNKLTASHSSIFSHDGTLPSKCSNNLSAAHVPLYAYQCSLMPRPTNNLYYMDHASNPNMFSLKSMHIDEEEDQFIEKSASSDIATDAEPESLYKSPNSNKHHEYRNNSNLKLSLDSNINSHSDPPCKVSVGSNSALLKRKKPDYLGRSMCASENSLLEVSNDHQLRDTMDD